MLLVPGLLAVTVVCVAGAAAADHAIATVQAQRPLLGSDHNGTIYSVQPSGAGFVRLFPCGLGDPSLSPDGRTYFAQGIEDDASLTYLRIFRLPISEPIETRCVTAHNERLPAADTGLKGWYPRVSPNGRRILFLDPKSFRVTTARVNGSGKRVIGPGGIYGANWSPDGSKIVLATRTFHSPCRTRPGQKPVDNPYCWTGQVQVMNANGSNLRTLYVVPKFVPLRQFTVVRAVDWSRNSKILFTMGSARRGGATRLAVINADGTGFRPVTSWPLRAVQGVWSPSGTQIAFATFQLGVWTVTSSGRGLRNVTKSFATNGLDW